MQIEIKQDELLGYLDHISMGIFKKTLAGLTREERVVLTVNLFVRWKSGEYETREEYDQIRKGVFA